MENSNEPILGYAPDKNGSMTPIIHSKGYIYTAAFILCRECGSVISGMGGPRYNALCVSCFEKAKENV